MAAPTVDVASSTLLLWAFKFTVGGVIQGAGGFPQVLHPEVQHEPVGPDPERTGDRHSGEFCRAVAMLAEGGLLFPAPFDVATSAALAGNIDAGDTALELFQVDRIRARIGYRVRIEAVLLDQPEVEEREVIDSVIPSLRLLPALLGGLLHEIASPDD